MVTRPAERRSRNITGSRLRRVALITHLEPKRIGCGWRKGKTLLRDEAYALLGCHPASCVCACCRGAGSGGVRGCGVAERSEAGGLLPRPDRRDCRALDRKSTRLNSSHLGISYAVFC